jgi:hypothetical protein
MKMRVGVEAYAALPSLKSAREDHGPGTRRVDSVKAPSSSRDQCGSVGHVEGMVGAIVRGVTAEAAERERLKPSVKGTRKGSLSNVGNDLNDTARHDS